MIDIDSILQTQTYHIFYKNKHLKQLSTPIPKKLDQLVKENVNPPKTNKKVFLIRIKSNPTNPKSKLIISCSQQTITSKLAIVAEKGDYFITVKYSEEELKNRAVNSNLLRLVHAYRAHGHRLADLDPLNLQPLE